MTRDGFAARLTRVVPLVWLVSVAAWAVVIIATDRSSWEPAIWIAATLGPIAAIDRSFDRRPNRGGTAPPGHAGADATAV